MATAARITREIVTTEPAVTLELSMEEAATLHSLMAFIAGDRSNSRRRHTDGIQKALSECLGMDYGRADICGTIRFEREA